MIRLTCKDCKNYSREEDSGDGINYCAENNAVDFHIKGGTVCRAFKRPAYELTPPDLLKMLNEIKEGDPVLFEKYTMDFLVNGKKVFYDRSMDESERLTLTFCFKEE